MATYGTLISHVRPWYLWMSPQKFVPYMVHLDILLKAIYRGNIARIGGPKIGETGGVGREWAWRIATHDSRCLPIAKYPSERRHDNLANPVTEAGRVLLTGREKINLRLLQN